MVERQQWNNDDDKRNKQKTHKERGREERVFEEECLFTSDFLLLRGILYVHSSNN